MWKRRIFDADERRNYIETSWQKILFMLVYTLIHIGLLIFRVIQYWEISRIAFDWWVIPARVGAMWLNFNCSVILYPTMRTVLNM